MKTIEVRGTNDVRECMYRVTKRISRGNGYGTVQNNEDNGLENKQLLNMEKSIYGVMKSQRIYLANPGFFRITGVVQDQEIEVLPETRLQWTRDCFHEVVRVTFEDGEFDCYRFHFRSVWAPL